MSVKNWISRLRPPTVLSEVRATTEADLVIRYPNGLLLVELAEDPGILEAGLQACRAGEAESARLIPALGTMEFHTALQECGGIPASAPKNHRAIEPRTSGSLYALPLGKRPGADQAFADRVSVGRARNMDVVFRSESVSKFHAWFQVDERDGLQVVDAGSKNGTAVNGNTIVSRQPMLLHSGDRVRFGGIDALWLATARFWTLLQR